MQALRERFSGNESTVVSKQPMNPPTTTTTTDVQIPPIVDDIGSEYDHTFSQTSGPQLRLALTTPNLWPSGGTRGGAHHRSLTLTSVHEAGSTNEEQLTANVLWGDTFGPTVVHTPTVVDKKKDGSSVRVGFEWNRPIHVDLRSYVCLPMKLSTVKPTMKVYGKLTDINSTVAVHGSHRLSGSEFIHTLYTSGRYGNIGASIKNDSKVPHSRIVSAGAATTLYYDRVLGRTLNAGVVIDSARYNSNETTYPTQLSGVTFKAEFDEPKWNIDTKIKASQYTDAGSKQQAIKLSEAHARVFYTHNAGTYPRWCLGGSIGMIDGGQPATVTSEVPATETQSSFHPYNDPDARFTTSLTRGMIGQLQTPVSSGSFYYQLNANNKFKMTLDSSRRLQTNYTYYFGPRYSLVASWIASGLPKLDSLGVSSDWNAIGSDIKNSLGLAISIQAD